MGLEIVPPLLIEVDIMINKRFKEPYDDEDLIYNHKERRYVLTEDYVRNMGVNLSLELNTDAMPEPSRGVEVVLDRISVLVYSNIYSHGRSKETKEYLLATRQDLRSAIRDAMYERLRYVIDSGDLSTRSGALISQGTRVERADLIASVIEEDILVRTGILHRGEWSIIIDPSIDY